MPILYGSPSPASNGKHGNLCSQTCSAWAQPSKTGDWLFQLCLLPNSIYIMLLFLHMTPFHSDALDISVMPPFKDVHLAVLVQLSGASGGLVLVLDGSRQDAAGLRGHPVPRTWASYKIVCWQWVTKPHDVGENCLFSAGIWSLTSSESYIKVEVVMRHPTTPQWATSNDLPPSAWTAKQERWLTFYGLAPFYDNKWVPQIEVTKFEWNEKKWRKGSTRRQVWQSLSDVAVVKWCQSRGSSTRWRASSVSCHVQRKQRSENVRPEVLSEVLFKVHLPPVVLLLLRNRLHARARVCVTTAKAGDIVLPIVDLRQLLLLPRSCMDVFFVTSATKGKRRSTASEDLRLQHTLNRCL